MKKRHTRPRWRWHELNVYYIHDGICNNLSYTHMHHDMHTNTQSKKYTQTIATHTDVDQYKHKNTHSDLHSHKQTNSNTYNKNTHR